MTIKDCHKGKRVELAPHLDLWMRGCRYGEIVGKGRTYAYVLLDKTPDRPPLRFHPSNLNPIA